MEKNNKLIAEFMGCTHPFNEITDATLYNVSHGTFELSELRYDASWDWLMPVVQKIESLGYVFTIQGGKAEYGEMISETRCFIAENKRSSTYKAVVEFIKDQNN